MHEREKVHCAADVIRKQMQLSKLQHKILLYFFKENLNWATVADGGPALNQKWAMPLGYYWSYIVTFVNIMTINVGYLRQNICIAFVQRRPNVADVGPTLYKCYTNVLCSLGIARFKW